MSIIRFLTWQTYYIVKTLKEMEQRIMATVDEAIQAFADKINADFAPIQDGIAALNTQVQTLTAQIATLQNSPGVISAADQATLDKVEATAAGIAGSLAGIATQTAQPIAAPPPAQP